MVGQQQQQQRVGGLLCVLYIRFVFKLELSHDAECGCGTTCGCSGTVLQQAIRSCTQQPQRNKWINVSRQPCACMHVCQAHVSQLFYTSISVSAYVYMLRVESTYICMHADTYISHLSGTSISVSAAPSIYVYICMHADTHISVAYTSISVSAAPSIYDVYIRMHAETYLSCLHIHISICAHAPSRKYIRIHAESTYACTYDSLV